MSPTGHVMPPQMWDEPDIPSEEIIGVRKLISRGSDEDTTSLQYGEMIPIQMGRTPKFRKLSSSSRPTLSGRVERSGSSGGRGSRSTSKKGNLQKFELSEEERRFLLEDYDRILGEAGTGFSPGPGFGSLFGRPSAHTPSPRRSTKTIIFPVEQASGVFQENDARPRRSERTKKQLMKLASPAQKGPTTILLPVSTNTNGKSGGKLLRGELGSPRSIQRVSHGKVSKPRSMKTSEPPRGRGRPRKLNIPTSQLIKPSEPARGRGRPRKSNIPAPQFIKPSEPPRRRGRPRKSTVSAPRSRQGVRNHAE